MLRKTKSKRLLAQMGKAYSHQRSTEKGLTLIESLAAIIIFSLAITAVTPPLILSMATRVRAHRAQQSMQLAQGEIDRVRLVVEAGPKKDDENNDPLDDYKDKLPPDAGDINLEDVPAPDGSSGACSDGLPTATQYCTVEVNGTTFGIQSFRTNTIEQASQSAGGDVPVAFNLGVRVYTQGSLNQGNLSTEPASLSFSARTDGSAPLIVQYATVVRSDLDHSAEDYRKLLGGE